MLLGLFGACLLYGDGAVTPAISVLSAVEGLRVAAPALAAFVLPVTIVILIGLFGVQRHGSGRIGRLIAPVMLLWFVVQGLRGIIMEPSVLAAFNPWYAVLLFANSGRTGFLTLGAAWLVVMASRNINSDRPSINRLMRMALT
jgi:KUP system potassium uptake protein